MDLSITGSTIFGISSALIIMWISIKNYEGYYSEKTLFKSLITGFVLGVAAFIVEGITYNIGLVFFIAFPFIEQSIKFMGINLPSYRKRRDTIIYGLTVGLGFGAVYMPLLTIMASKYLRVSIHLFVLSLIFGLGIIMFHGGTGCMIGYGLYRDKEKWKYLVYTILIGIPLPLIEISTLYLKDVYAVALFRSLEALYGASVLFISYKKFLPYSLPRNRRKDLL